MKSILLTILLVAMTLTLAAQRPEVLRQPGRQLAKSLILVQLNDDIRPVAVCASKEGKWTSVQETCAPCTYACIIAIINKPFPDPASARSQKRAIGIPSRPNTALSQKEYNNTILLPDEAIQTIVDQSRNKIKQACLYICNSGTDVIASTDPTDCVGRLLIDVVEYSIKQLTTTRPEGYR
ncbi:hypothetical protein [Lewinella sp. W8]|uniref:hypothetical protein n=1 Tax=Lewinella sp. W8 TaxID=2528208 RepID=UPI001067AC9C|nr:hypothetical protein [Lewinella sp. W8]MTB53491.1 hypothetical protein [Lewinella sp. W8]